MNVSNLYPNDLFNGGWEEDCRQRVKVISNKNKLKIFDDQINFEIRNSCLNKSLCRGWSIEIFFNSLWDFFFDNYD